MKVLVACEFSGIVREAFKAREHNDSKGIQEGRVMQVSKQGFQVGSSPADIISMPEFHTIIHRFYWHRNSEHQGTHSESLSPTIPGAIYPKGVD